MPRILGTDIPNERPLWIALTYLHGIGRTTSRRMLEDMKINPFVRARDVPEEEVGRIAAYIEANDMLVEGALRRKVAQDIQRLKEIRCYRGQRHKMNLPVRGQQTQSNARTRKGKKRTVAGKQSVKAKK
ncbi:MAG: 30S ribosomal protein S13 [Planctomycetota bacterium]